MSLSHISYIKLSFYFFCVSLHQDYLACSSDLQEVLQQDPNLQEAEKELEEVTKLLRQSLASASPNKPRKTVPITEVNTVSSLPLKINIFPLLHPTDISTFDFRESTRVVRKEGHYIMMGTKES